MWREANWCGLQQTLDRAKTRCPTTSLRPNNTIINQFSKKEST